MSKNVLVTGGAGYIGVHTAVELIKAGYNVTLIDDFSKSDFTLLRGLEKITGKKPDFLEGDCSDRQFLRTVLDERGAFTSALHFAAFKSVGESVEKPLSYYRNNITSLISLLEIMHEFNVENIIFSSSCTVYGQPDLVPVNEHAPFKRAESPYGATKQMCERILEDAVYNGFKIISLRYFNPIGAHPSGLIGEIPVGPPNNLVPYITQTAAGVRDKLTIFGGDYNTPDGTCIRDFIHVTDLALAHVRAMEYLTSMAEKQTIDAFNIGTGEGISVLQLVNEFLRVTGVQLPYTIGPRRPGDVEKVYADPSKSRSILGWKHNYSIADCLLHAWQWEKRLRNIHP